MSFYSPLTMSNSSEMIQQLAKVSQWHADRVCRLLDNGCPTDTLSSICSQVNFYMREEQIEDEEHKLGLGLLEDGEVEEQEQHLSFSSNTSNTSNTLEYRVDHQKRIIEHMEEREKWFQSRIEQLEAFGKKVSLELSELKKKHPEPPRSVLPISEFAPPPLNLGNLSLPCHQRLAQNIHNSILEEDDLIQGMTPTVPLIRIPTHSLKKAISWNDVESAGSNAFGCGSATASTATTNAFTIPCLSNCSLQRQESLCMWCPVTSGCDGNHDDEEGQESWCMWCPVTSGCDGDHGDEMRDGFIVRKS